MTHRKISILVIFFLMPIGSIIKQKQKWSLCLLDYMTMQSTESQLTYSSEMSVDFQQTIGIFITTSLRSSNRTTSKNVYPRLECICFQNMLFCKLKYIIYMIFIYYWYTAAQLQFISLHIIKCHRFKSYIQNLSEVYRILFVQQSSSFTN
jgi:hypothetical protein